MKHHSHLNSAVSILKSYTGDEPFHFYIKRFFSNNKKYGSKDRRSISSLCYHYFRLGHAAKTLPADERIMLATFLCEKKPGEFLQYLKPEWNDSIALSVEEKIKISGHSFTVAEIFPWKNELAAAVDQDRFCKSFLLQPLLYLRLRPGKEQIVKDKLTAAGIAFSIIGEQCIAVANNSKVDGVIELDKEAVVQDLNSQQAIKTSLPEKKNDRPVTWDCCAASGGKSIQLYDLFNGKIDLHVSDIRPSIINNLKERFKKAGIKHYQSFIVDLIDENSKFNIQHSTFDIILCDAPCTGSGTWSRTPEQLFFFDKKKIAEYSARQKAIVSAVIPKLAQGGLFIYITCSVFKEENESIAEFIKEKFHLEAVKMELLKGYDKYADNMFLSVFRLKVEG